MQKVKHTNNKSIIKLQPDQKEGNNMYYLLIATATVLFSFQFLFNKNFEVSYGEGLNSAIVFSVGTSTIGLVSMLITNQFRIEFSLFSFMLAFAIAITNILFTYFSIKALSRTNLSVYSMFAMLGGMVLPFVLGMTFYREDLTVGKIICFLAIGISLFLGIEKKSGAKSENRYYLYVFILNGMYGVISKTHQSYSEINISSSGFIILSYIITFVLSIIIFICMLSKNQKSFRMPVKNAVLNIIGYGIFFSVGNLLVLISLIHLPASVQYPMITGGVMIISTIISFARGERPKKRTVIAVTLAFAGILLLVI